MHRIDVATAVPVPPARQEPGTPGYFTSGDFIAGVAATVPGADWFNMMQEEFAAVVLAADLELDRDDDSQLLQAIRKIAASAATIDTIPGLRDALDGMQPTGDYALVGHQHQIGDVEDLVAVLNGLAAIDHTHVMADIDGLVDALAGKASLTGANFTGPVTSTGNITAPRIRLTVTTDVSLSSTNHAFQIGPDTGANVRMDGNEIMAVNNGATATLVINGDGGSTSFGGAITAAGQIGGSGGFQPTSSRELKTAFRENPYGLDAVLKLETTLGKYRKWFNPDNRERVFLIHENIAEVIPQAASGKGIEATPPGASQPRRYGGYDIEQLLAVYAKAFQDLNAIVQAQDERIATLESNRS